MKKIVSLILCFVLLTCTVAMTAYATEKESATNLIDHSQIPREMYDLFDEHNINVDGNSRVYMVEVTSGRSVANGLLINNHTLSGLESNMIVAFDVGDSSRSSGSELINIVEKVSGNSRATFNWTFSPGNASIAAKAIYDVDYSYSPYLVRPKTVGFTSNSSSVSYCRAFYSCKGKVYSYPAGVDQGYIYEHLILKAVSSPTRGTYYSKTNALISDTRIAPKIGSPLEGCGQYLCVDCTVSGTTHNLTMPFDN